MTFAREIAGNRYNSRNEPSATRAVRESGSNKVEKVGKPGAGGAEMGCAQIRSRGRFIRNDARYV